MSSMPSVALEDKSNSVSGGGCSVVSTNGSSSGGRNSSSNDKDSEKEVKMVRS